MAEKTNKGLGTKEDELQLRADRKEIEKTGNKTTGTPSSEERDDQDLERGKSMGDDQDTGTTTRTDQEEGSGAGRSGSLGKNEQQQREQPDKGNEK